MSTQILMTWDSDFGGKGGDATYFEGTPYEAIVAMRTFQDAHDLSLSIQDALRAARREGRMELLQEIGRIEP